jgi:hypothetical protein
MTTLTDHAKAPPEIAALGDIVFLVGPDSVRLRVLSLLLRTFPKVF